MKDIHLTKGQVAVVGDEDYEYLKQYRWYYEASIGYARASIKTNGFGKKSLYTKAFSAHHQMA